LKPTRLTILELASEVVHAVGGDGNAAGQYTNGDLAASQQ